MYIYLYLYETSNQHSNSEFGCHFFGVILSAPVSHIHTHTQNMLLSQVPCYAHTRLYDDVARMRVFVCTEHVLANVCFCYVFVAKVSRPTKSSTNITSNIMTFYLPLRIIRNYLRILPNIFPIFAFNVNRRIYQMTNRKMYSHSDSCMKILAMGESHAESFSHRIETTRRRKRKKKKTTLTKTCSHHYHRHSKIAVRRTKPTIGAIHTHRLCVSQSAWPLQAFVT